MHNKITIELLHYFFSSSSFRRSTYIMYSYIWIMWSIHIKITYRVFNTNIFILFFCFWLDSVSKQENFIIIKTAPESSVGKCQVNPTFGMAWMTLFNITCTHLRDYNLSYYYYEQYENVNYRGELSNEIHNFVVTIISIVMYRICSIRILWEIICFIR